MTTNKTLEECDRNQRATIAQLQAEVRELKRRDGERLELLLAKGEEIAGCRKVIANYKIGIDDLLDALRPHADAGDVESSNIMASLLSIKRTAERK
jgi:hypothetical protein